MEVSIQIKYWRNVRGLTQAKLAEMAGISRSYLAGVECGNYNPSLETLNSIAKALGLEASDLIHPKNFAEAVIDNTDASNAEKPVFLTEEDRLLLEKFRKLDEGKRDAIMTLLGLK